jgi:hypothetical protein
MKQALVRLATWLVLLLPGAGDTVGQDRIQDPRLESDSTLFPYEWPALNELERELSRLRPALESGEVRELADVLPEVAAGAGRLLADSLPTLLAPRRQELRGRMIALASAVRRAQELAPAALAAPPRPPAGEDSLLAAGGPVAGFPSGEPAGAVDGGVRGDWRLDRSDAAPGDSAARGEGADSLGAAPADSLGAAGPDTSGAAAVDPVETYFDAWRDIYLHAEALVHRLRDPTGEDVE